MQARATDSADHSAQSKLAVTGWLFEAETRKESLLTGVTENSAVKTLIGSGIERRKTSQLKHSRLATSPPCQLLMQISTGTAVCKTEW